MPLHQIQGPPRTGNATGTLAKDHRISLLRLSFVELSKCHLFIPQDARTKEEVALAKGSFLFSVLHLLLLKKAIFQVSKLLEIPTPTTFLNYFQVPFLGLNISCDHPKLDTEQH